MDIKEWLEKALNVPTAETAFKKAQKLPFTAFIDKTKREGHDTANCITEHDLTVEYYDNVINKENEGKYEAMFDAAGIEYEKDREWIDTEKMYITVYTAKFKEKEI